jgi:steroid delta-isomerase-like uncharacterized protein
MRSASPNLDPTSARQGPAPIEEDGADQDPADELAGGTERMTPRRVYILTGTISLGIGPIMPVNLTENKALVRRYYDEVLTARNRSVLGQLLDSSFVSHVYGGSDVGAEAYAAAVDATFAAFSDLAVTVHDQVAEEDKVVTRWSATGTHDGDFVGVPASGRLITVTGIHIHRVRHGRLVEHWEELNMLGVLRQLGVLS